MYSSISSIILAIGKKSWALHVPWPVADLAGWVELQASGARHLVRAPMGTLNVAVAVGGARVVMQGVVERALVEADGVNV